MKHGKLAFIALAATLLVPMPKAQACVGFMSNFATGPFMLGAGLAGACLMGVNTLFGGFGNMLGGLGGGSGFGRSQMQMPMHMNMAPQCSYSYYHHDHHNHHNLNKFHNFNNFNDAGCCHIETTTMHSCPGF